MRASNGLWVAVLGLMVATGCSTSGNSKMPSLAWWKKDAPADAVVSTPSTPAAPQLPSAGSTPPVTTPAMPDGTQVATATYPTQPAGAVSPYPTTDTPTAFAPMTPPGAVAPGPAYSPYPNPAATAAVMPPSTTGGIAPQTSPYNPAYGNAADTTSAAASPYPGTGYPTAGTSEYAANAGSGYGAGAPAASYGSSLPESSAAADDRYAQRDTAPTAQYGDQTVDRYSNAPADDRYGATTNPPVDDRYSAAANPPADERTGPPIGDRYADSRFGDDRYGAPAGAGSAAGVTAAGGAPAATTAATGSFGGTAPSPRRDPFYRPGNTSDYRPASGSGANSSHLASPTGSSIQPAGFAAPPANSQPAATPTMSDRYGTAPASRY